MAVAELAGYGDGGGHHGTARSLCFEPPRDPQIQENPTWWMGKCTEGENKQCPSLKGYGMKRRRQPFTYFDVARIERGDAPTEVARDHEEETLARDERGLVEAGRCNVQLAGELAAVEPVRLGAHEAARGVGGAEPLEARDDVVGQDARLGRGRDLADEQRLHHGLGRGRGREPVVRRAHEVRDPAPEREVVGDLLRPRPDPLPRQPEPQHRRREGVHGADAVEVVDGHAVRRDVVVRWVRPRQCHDALPHRCV